MSTYLRLLLLALALAFGTSARAEPATASVTVCAGAIEPMTVTACAATAIALHEVFIAKKPFGENGEGMKILRKPLGGRNSVFKKPWKLKCAWSTPRRTNSTPSLGLRQLQEVERWRPCVAARRQGPLI